MRPAILLIAFAAQYVPWMLVPRGTYIYHYFPSVPFIILCIALCMDLFYDWTAVPGRDARLRWAPVALCGLWMAVALALFIAFFPYISGCTASTAWLRAMQWFRGWIYY